MRIAILAAAAICIGGTAVSQHLKVLMSAGVVVVRTEGTRRLYTADSHAIEAMRTWLDGCCDKPLTAFKAAAERAAAKERGAR
jgi:DNA-binding transcriptional ArsR family regulator